MNDESARGDRFQTAALLLARDFAGVRLLLVEDDLLNQELGRVLLTHAGLLLDVADDGIRAIEKLVEVQPCPYSIVLMDMQMPRLDDLEATRRIRAMPGFANLPIIAMTANSLDEDRDRCSAAGMNDFISKPIEPELLYATVHHWLQQARAGQ